ncbi:MAG: radical SAM protein [Bacteroidales bacterium]|nr:radical SAM protein [Bacteroidales bacterium]
MKPRLPFVSYEVTMNCNLKCRFCYNHFKGTDSTPKESSYVLADKALRRIFKVFDIGQITFTGGEPFLGERFSELVLTARLKGASVGIISNGNFAEKEKYFQLINLGVKLFELPIHSYNPEIHDFMTRCKASHKKSVNIINALKEKGIMPTVVIVLTKFNAENIDKTIQYISNLGINKIMLNRYNIGGEGVLNPQEILPSKTQLKEAFKRVSDEALKNKLNVYSSVCTPVCILNPQDYKGIHFSFCSFEVSKRPVTIDYLGNLRFCNHSPVVLGNIFKDTPQEIFSNPKSSEWKATIPDFCKNCTKYSVCKAGCRAASQQYGLGLNSPDPILDFLKN